jgi:hypothetical protein
MSFRDDVGYIGYLTDVDDNDNDNDNDNDIDDSGGVVTVGRRRRELLALDSDISFTSSVCLFVIVTFLVALFSFLVAASPWGVPPPSYGRRM